MSEVIFLRSESDLESGVSKFTDLKTRLEQQLNLVKKITDLEQVIRSVNDLVKDSRYSPDEKSDLKRIRQKAYDRKRNFKPSEDVSMSIAQELITEPIQERIIQQEEKPIMGLQSIEHTPIQKEVTSLPAQKDFWGGFQLALDKIDGERFAQALPSFLAILIPTALVVGFLWSQSTDLYKSSGFANPEFAAAGGLLMIVGFAAYYSVRKTKLALLLCLYAASFEIYFMSSGTVQDERVVASDALAKEPELILLKEKSEKAQDAYKAIKVRYEDPTSTVHNNSWYKTKQLDPAWEKSEQAQKEFIAKRNELKAKSSSEHVTWLKIFYRLGLVFLCMVLVHAFVKKFNEF